MPYETWKTPKPSRTPVNVVTVRSLYITIPKDNGNLNAGDKVDILYDKDAQRIALKKDGATREVKAPSGKSERRLRVYAKQFIDTLEIPHGRYDFSWNAELNALEFSYAPPKEE